jgi:hypothetical protein
LRRYCSGRCFSTKYSTSARVEKLHDGGDGQRPRRRKKGVPNKLTTGAKEVIAQVAENIGGVARMTKWVRESKKNEHAFWTSIYTKLLPLQVAGDQDNPLTVTVVFADD